MKELLRNIASGDQQEEQEEEPERRDVDVILSCPGLGTRNAATLLGLAQQAVSTRSYRLLRCYAGQAPVTRQSGKQRTVQMRRACNPLVREAVYHWARVSVQRDARSKELYEAAITRGHGYARALRAVADRNIAMLCAMLRNGTLYNPERRQRRGAALD